MNKHNPLLFWLDCEMTGLDVNKDNILEIGIKISDFNANNVIDGPSYVIKMSLEKLQSMDEWCRRTHFNNGLWEESLASNSSILQAENAIVDWISSLNTNQERYLSGSSIWCDRVFLNKEMPKLSAMFHYRMLDVSSLKLLFKHSLNKPYNYTKSERHRVMEDLNNSILEYRYYLEQLKCV